MKKEYIFNKSLYFVILILSLGLATSCEDDENPINPGNPDIVQEWTMTISPDQEIPAVMGRDETGIVELTLYENNELQYSIRVDGLSSADVLTAAHIHDGMPSENGDIVISLTDSFTGSTADGIIQLSQSQVDALDTENEHYVNVHSTMEPAGLLRANLGDNIDWARDIDLDTPTSGVNAGGTAYLRKAGDDLYYWIELMDGSVMAGDTLTAAHIHEGAEGVTGDPRIFLYTDREDFDAKMVDLSSEQRELLISEPAYVNVHTTEYNGGLVRGQIR